MDRQEIIRMAADAGITPWVYHQWVKDKFIHIDEGLDGDLACLMQFANLVAAAECNKLAAWMIKRGYATGHGDTTEDLLKELDWQVLENWSSAMKTGAENEREACAKVCEQQDEQNTQYRYDYRRGVLDCADAIRQRGEL